MFKNSPVVILLSKKATRTSMKTNKKLHACMAVLGLASASVEIRNIMGKFSPSLYEFHSL